MGLPTRADGKIDFDLALKWLSANNLGETGSRAGRLLQNKKDAPPIPAGLGAIERFENVFDKGIVLALLHMVTRINAHAAIAAHEAGASCEVAERTGQLALGFYIDAASKFLVENGVEPFASNPDMAIWPAPHLHDEVNWPALVGSKTKGLK
jgi:hypothetical protein